MKIAPWFLLAWAGLCSAHEVDHSLATATAAVVTLSYADGRPFAYEKYELYPAGQEVPAQVGNSDSQGRIVFLPGKEKQWRLKAYSADGHGVDYEFTAPATETAQAMVDAPAANRTSLVVFGLALILAAFGLYQLLLRRKG